MSHHFNKNYFRLPYLCTHFVFEASRDFSIYCNFSLQRKIIKNVSSVRRSSVAGFGSTMYVEQRSFSSTVPMRKSLSAGSEFRSFIFTFQTALTSWSGCLSHLLPSTHHQHQINADSGSRLRRTGLDGPSANFYTEMRHTTASLNLFRIKRPIFLAKKKE